MAPLAQQPNSLPLMGIRNWRSAALFRRRGSTHYPSWGSETLVLARRAPCTLSHYPSWGSETSLVFFLLQLALDAHYPSWGSETRGRKFARVRVDQLTTPHGDQKPFGPRALPCTLARLTTPHGDQKLPAGLPVLVTGAPGSLPLMGIRNQVRTSGFHEHADVSLPLMGIRNDSG